MKSYEPQKINDLPVNQKSSLNDVDDLLWNFGRWLTNEDEYSDIIISSRIRLARNLNGYPFPNKASKADLVNILDKTLEACNKCKSLNQALYFNIDKLSDWDCNYFVERRLASPQFIEKKRPALLVVGPQECLSIMVNEEDHLRIQTIEAGLGIKNAWRIISTADDELEEKLQYSYSNKFGYLTACPTNIGTGLRVSFFAHLPALSIKNQINAVINQLPTSEIAVRGFYGEGTETVGNIFQISNQHTLGRTETNIIKRMTQIAKKIVDIEREARNNLFEEDRVKLEDVIFRAQGILKNARIISSLESMKLLSSVRLGCELGLVNNINRLAINQLMVLIQPAHLQKIYNKKLDAQERDISRADFIKQNLQI